MRLTLPDFTPDPVDYSGRLRKIEAIEPPDPTPTVADVKNIVRKLRWAEVVETAEQLGITPASLHAWSGSVADRRTGEVWRG